MILSTTTRGGGSRNERGTMGMGTTMTRTGMAGTMRPRKKEKSPKRPRSHNNLISNSHGRFLEER